MIKLRLNFNNDNFDDFLEKLKDLSKIDDIIKIKIDREYILMYSTMSSGSSILSLKTFNIDTRKYIIDFDEDYTMDLIITDSSKLLKSLNFLDRTKQILADIVCEQSPEDKNTKLVRSVLFSNGKLKINHIGGEAGSIKDINKNLIESRLDPKNSIWNFSLKIEDFISIKRLSAINSDDKILDIKVINNSIKFGEPGKWELEVGEIEHNKNYNVSFIKKYLSSVNIDEEFVNFFVFETFILIKDSKSNLMVSYETDFED